MKFDFSFRTGQKETHYLTVKKKRLIIILTLTGGAALITVFISLNKRSTAEPTVYGRSVSEWITSDDFETNRATVDLALVTLGEKSVPVLREILLSGSKSGRLWLNRAPQAVYRRFPLGADQYERKNRAMDALQVLGRNGSAAAPELLMIVEDSSEHHQQRIKAINTLLSIHADDSMVLPVLDTHTNDPAIGKIAAEHARLRRRSVESSTTRDTLGRIRSYTSSDTSNDPSPRFQTSDSFLTGVSLWGSDESTPSDVQSQPDNSESNTNPPAALEAEIP